MAQRNLFSENNALKNKSEILSYSTIVRPGVSVVGVYRKSDSQFSIMTENTTLDASIYTEHEIDLSDTSITVSNPINESIALNFHKYKVSDFNKRITTLKESGYVQTYAGEISSLCAKDFISRINDTLSGHFDNFYSAVKVAADDINIQLTDVDASNKCCCVIF